MPHKVLCVFGTRPEAIKFAPVIAELTARRNIIANVNVITSQHTDLLDPLIDIFDIKADYRLAPPRQNRHLNELSAAIEAGLDPILEKEQPSAVLVQGDTTTAVAAAMASYYRRIPVAHIEAGLRSGNLNSPFPEEMNRRLITQLASLHFAATPHNVDTLAAEGVSRDQIVLTGNPVVDALKAVLASTTPSPVVHDILAAAAGRDIILLTTHRRESFETTLRPNLEALRNFVAKHPRYFICFPVHPNPMVREAARQILGNNPNVLLSEPMAYPDFLHLLGHAVLIVSDSGGLQEEVPTLGKPLLILRDTTERPESVTAGVARLVGGNARELARLLDEFARDGDWARSVRQIENPFGRGDAAKLIVNALQTFLENRRSVDLQVA